MKHGFSADDKTDRAPRARSTWQRRLAVWILVVALFPLTGCGPEGPETYPVSGAVTFDGQPIPEGDILFVPADGRGVPDPGKIENGRFEFRAKPGPKRVEIEASRPSGPADPNMGMAPRESYIPTRYNTQTTLTAEVTPEGDNEFTFALDGNPAEDDAAR